jgi:hypothetical protein
MTTAIILNATLILVVLAVLYITRDLYQGK